MFAITEHSNNPVAGSGTVAVVTVRLSKKTLFAALAPPLPTNAIERMVVPDKDRVIGSLGLPALLMLPLKNALSNATAPPVAFSPANPVNKISSSSTPKSPASIETEVTGAENVAIKLSVVSGAKNGDKA